MTVYDSLSPEVRATMDRADTFVATAPAVMVYCTVQACSWAHMVETEDEQAMRLAARAHVIMAHKSLLVSSETGTIEA